MSVPGAWPLSSLSTAYSGPVSPSAFDHRGKAPAFQRSLGSTVTVKFWPRAKVTPVELPVPPELLFVNAVTTTAWTEVAEMPTSPATSAHANNARLNLKLIVPPPNLIILNPIPADGIARGRLHPLH